MTPKYGSCRYRERVNLLSSDCDSISMGLPPSDKIALTSFSLLAFPVTKTAGNLGKENKWKVETH
jgi:hypothetical protein